MVCDKPPGGARICETGLLSMADFTIVAKDSLFWLSIVTSPQLICDVTQM